MLESTVAPLFLAVSSFVRLHRKFCCLSSVATQRVFIWRKMRESNSDRLSPISRFPGGRLYHTDYIFQMVEGRGVEPHPFLQQNLVFKASRHTNAPALPSICLASRQGFEPRPTVLETAMLPLNTSEILFTVKYFLMFCNKRQYFI